MLQVTVPHREDVYQTRRSEIQIHVLCDKMQRKLICNTYVSEQLAARFLRVGCRISAAGVFRDRVQKFSVRKSAITRIRDNFRPKRSYQKSDFSSCSWLFYFSLISKIISVHFHVLQPTVVHLPQIALIKLVHLLFAIVIYLYTFVIQISSPITGSHVKWTARKKWNCLSLLSEVFNKLSLNAS